MVRKKVLLLVLSLATVVATMAFTLYGKSSVKVEKQKKTLNYQYLFLYVGPSYPLDFSEYTDPDNYVLMGDEDIPGNVCPFGDEALCCIYCERQWNAYEWKPDFSSRAAGNTWQQLYDYYYMGGGGMSLFTKAL